jgi:hypothetical protein
MQFNNLSVSGGETPYVVRDTLQRVKRYSSQRTTRWVAQAYTHKQEICLLSATALELRENASPSRLQIATEGPEVKVRHYERLLSLCNIHGNR